MKNTLTSGVIIFLLLWGDLAAGTSKSPNTTLVLATREVHQANADLYALVENGALARPYDRKQAIAALVKMRAPTSSPSSTGEFLVMATPKQHEDIAKRLAILGKATFDPKTGFFTSGTRTPR